MTAVYNAAGDTIVKLHVKGLKKFTARLARDGPAVVPRGVGVLVEVLLSGSQRTRDPLDRVRRRTTRGPLRAERPVPQDSGRVAAARPNG